LEEGYSFKNSAWSFHNLQKSKIAFAPFPLKLELLKGRQKRNFVAKAIIQRTHKPEVVDIKSYVQTIFILLVGMSV